MAKTTFTPDHRGMQELAQSSQIGEAMVRAAQTGAAAVEGGRARSSMVTVLGRWGGQRAGAVIESDQASYRDLLRSADVVERGT